MGARLVVQLHADASPLDEGPDQARVFYWPGNPAGQEAALRAVAGLSMVLPWGVQPTAATSIWGGPRACLAAVRPTSILIEVGFTDGPRGRVLLPGLAQGIGTALGRCL